MTRLLQIAPRLALSAGFSLLALGLVLRLAGSGGDRVGFAELLAALRAASLPLIGVYFVCTLAQTVLRAARYRLLLAAMGGAVVPGFRQIFMATAARNMFVDVLPARLGELSYAAMLNRGCAVAADACFASMAVSMFLDFAALLAIVAVSGAFALLAPSPPAWVAPAMIATAAITAVFGAFVFVGLRWCSAIMRRMPWLARFRPTRALAGFVVGLAGAVRNSTSARVMAGAFALSVGVRAFKYGGFYMAFLGVTLRSAPELAGAPPLGVILALLAAEAAVALPIPTLLGFGAYEAGGLLALTALGYPEGVSVITMLTMHIYSQAIDYLIGGSALAVFFWTARGAKRQGRSQAEPDRGRGPWPAAAACAAVLLAGAAFFANEWRGARRLGSLVPPEPGAPAVGQPDDLARLRALTTNLNGFIVWSSNRSGNHEIYRLSMPGLELTRLTDNPHADYFPRVSPDGRLVAFCRSRLPWVSQRDELSWDIFILNLADGTERLVAEHANAPSWSPDGRSLYFQLEGRLFAEGEIATGRTNVLFEAGVGPVPAGVVLQTPSYNRDAGLLAVTLRGRQRRTAVFSKDGRDIRVGAGCQLFWAPDFSFLYLTLNRGGNMGNLFARHDLESGATAPWFDMPGEWSHEYFPKLSADGRFLAFGAAARGHEHDTADYEIFLWKVGSPPADAARVTFHSGNDCWPDIWLADEPAP